MPTKTLGCWLEVKSSIGRWSGGHSPGGRCPTRHRVSGVSGAFSWSRRVFALAQMLVALVLPFPVCRSVNNAIMKTQDGDPRNTFCSRESGREGPSQSEILLLGHFREDGILYNPVLSQKGGLTNDGTNDVVLFFQH